MQNHPSIRNGSLIARNVKRRRLNAVLLAFFLGPLGLFYTDSFGGFVTSVIALIMLLIAPLAGIILIWIACMIWAAISANRALSRAKEHAPYFSGRY